MPLHKSAWRSGTKWLIVAAMRASHREGREHEKDARKRRKEGHKPDGVTAARQAQFWAKQAAGRIICLNHVTRLVQRQDGGLAGLD